MSEVGNESHTPDSPHMRGIMIRSGMRKITCRANPRKIDLAALPMAIKKLVHTIWKPTTEKASMESDSACRVAAIRPASDVKARATTPPNIKPNRLPAVVMSVATPAVIQNAFLRRP